MRRAAFAASAAALALAACARSEPAETDFNQSMIEASPPLMNEAAVPEMAQAATTDLPVAAAIRAALAGNGGLGAGAKWMIARADLNGDGKDEAIAYVVDPSICGTGGCPLYILSDNGSNGFQVIDTIGPAQLPVYVLSPGGADGWATLGVTIGGGGAERALMSIPHDANGYTDNPTVAPAKKAQPGTAKPLIEDDFAKAVAVPGEPTQAPALAPAPASEPAPQG